MKKLFFGTLFIFISIFAFAQPSAGTMMAKIKAKHPKGLISASFAGKAISERLYEDGVWNTYYRRSYTIKSRTKHAGVTQVYGGGLQYKKTGGRYIYDQFLVGDWYYLGIPNPNKQEVLKLLKADLKKFLQSYHYNKIVGDVSEITFPANAKYHWNKLTSVNFDVNVTYAESVSYTEIEKAVHTYEVNLRSDVFKGPWVKFLSSYQGHKKKVISKTTYTSDEIEAMKTLADIDDENLAKAEYADLPDVGKIPVFESEKQLFYFIHDKVMTKDAKTVKAFLYKVLSKQCMHSELLLNTRDQQWVDNIFNNVETYKKTHCVYPAIKHQQAGFFEFYDKENRRILGYTGSYEEGTWKLRSIRYYVAKPDDIARMQNSQNNCQAKPNLAVKKIVQYKAGDKVNAKFSNGTFPYVINKKDGSNDRYYIKAEGDPAGRGYWMNGTSLTSRTVDDAVEEKTTEGKTEDKVETTTIKPTFNIGDKVGVKTRTGVLYGEIIRYASRKFLIKFEKNYQDMWVAPDNLVKE